VRLEPLFDGGGQERTLRSGTLPAPLVVGFGAAAAIVTAERDIEATRIGDLRDLLLKGLQQRILDLYVNGSMEYRVAGNLNIGFKGISSEALMDALMDSVALSSGSACTSAAVEPSYVLRAIGMSDEDAHASVRLCVGRMTTPDEIETAIEAIADAVQMLRGGTSVASVA